MITMAPASTTTSSDPSVTDWITAICAIATAAIALFAAIYAVRQWSVARAARQDAQDAEIARSQPYVAVFIEVPAEHPSMADLVVKNFGVTAARDVRFEFSTPLQRSAGGATNAFFTIPDMPYLAPGQEWRTWWDSGPSRRAQPDLPKRFDGVVRYRGLNGSDQESGLVLDLEPLESRIYTDSKNLRHVVEAIDNVSAAITEAGKGGRPPRINLGDLPF